MNNDLDILMTRVVDGVATPADWSNLETQAQARPLIWREVALAQRDQRLLSIAVSEAISGADGVDLPEGVARSAVGVRRSRTPLSAWAGWAVAAGIAVAFGFAIPRNTASDQPQQAGLLSLDALKNSLSTDQARDLYLERGLREGKVLAELPNRKVLDVRSSPEGVRVVFVRPIIEQAVVRDPTLYRVSQDEMGNQSPVRIELSPEALERVLRPLPTNTDDPSPEASPAVRRPLFHQDPLMPDWRGRNINGTSSAPQSPSSFTRRTPWRAPELEQDSPNGGTGYLPRMMETMS